MRLGKRNRAERRILVFPTAGSGTPPAAGPAEPAPSGADVSTRAEPEPVYSFKPQLSQTQLSQTQLSQIRLPTRVALPLLLALLVATTVGGVVIGRTIGSRTVAVEQAPPVQSASTSTSSPALLTPPPMKQKAIIHTSWGPLKAVPFGRLPSGAGVSGAFGADGQLTVIDADKSGAVFSGPAGSALPQIAELPYRLTAAAAVPAGGSVLLIGGAQGSKPTDEILELRLRAGQLVTGRKFTEPLADAGVVPQNRHAYLVGGWTGEKYATAVLDFTPPDQSTLVARLPEGVRSPAVALVGRILYVAGGRTASGLSRAVYAVDTTSGTVKTLGKLPHPVNRALLVASGSKLYLLGGSTAGKKALDTIVQIDPRTGKATAAGRMPHPLAGGTAVPYGKDTLVLGDSSGVIYRIRSAA